GVPARMAAPRRRADDAGRVAGRMLYWRIRSSAPYDCAGVAKLADARDSKSCSPDGECRFESDLRHHPGSRASPRDSSPQLHERRLSARAGSCRVSGSLSYTSEGIDSNMEAR